MTQLPVHPDDLLFFNEVAEVMRKVAKIYDLPLRSITGYPMPTKGMADRLGECYGNGDIRLVMRATVNGVWCEEPRTPELVWKTAAHELAHLRHMNHGVAFQEFHDELMEAVKNRREDHQDKIIKKLVKMQAAREGEAAVGNAAAAEAFAGMINKMMLEYELNPNDLDYARATDNDPVVEIKVNFNNYGYPNKKVRIAWEETMARVVAKAHLCSFLLRPGSNQIWFVGTKSHATVAEYVYGTLLPIATKLAHTEYCRYYWDLDKRGESVTLARGFKGAWLDAFVDRIAERFNEARAAAVSAVPDDAGGSSTALLRLDGALVKVRKYIDDKFASTRRVAESLHGGAKYHKDGRAWGRAAADRMTLGRRGVTGNAVRGLLG